VPKPGIRGEEVTVVARASLLAGLFLFLAHAVPAQGQEPVSTRVSFATLRSNDQDGPSSVAGTLNTPQRQANRLPAVVILHSSGGADARGAAYAAALNKAGIEVRYLAFPREGLSSATHDKMVSVWCAKERQQAFTDAKAGKSVPEKKCDNPVKEHMELGEKMGVSGTPAIILENGELVPGFVPPKRLAAMLDEKQD